MTWAGVNSIRYLPVFWGDRSGQRSSKTIVFFHSIASRLFLGEGGHTLQQLDKDRSIGQKPFFFFFFLQGLTGYRCGRQTNLWYRI